jgi:IS5 family transposase
VRRVKIVCIPQRGGQKTVKRVPPIPIEENVKLCRQGRETYEKSGPFKQGQCFRAGIEGRISVLFRGRGTKRCLASGG